MVFILSIFFAACHFTPLPPMRPFERAMIRQRDAFDV